MADQLTPTADKTPEQIERDMLNTRGSLTEKVTALENQVVGTVQNAADTLTGTVDAVKSLISNAPGAVTDSVKQAASAVSRTMKDAFDVTGHIQARPWTSVGISAGLGFLAGLLVFRERAPAPAAPAAPVTPLVPVMQAPAGRGVFDELFTMLGQKVRALAETVMDSTSDAVNRKVRDNVPKLVDAAEDRLTPEPHPGRVKGVGGFRGMNGLSAPSLEE